MTALSVVNNLISYGVTCVKAYTCYRSATGNYLVVVLRTEGGPHRDVQINGLPEAEFERFKDAWTRVRNR